MLLHRLARLSGRKINNARPPSRRDGVFAAHSVLSACDRRLQIHAVRHPECKLCKTCVHALTQDIDARRREAFAQLGATFGHVAVWPAGQLLVQPEVQG